MRMSGIKAKTFLLSLLAVALAACSMVNVAYNNADTAVYWYFDDYFDFNSGQRALFDQGLQRIHVWHRSVEVPKYAALCSEAAIRVEAGLKRADLDWLEGALRTRFNVLVQHSSGELASAFAAMEPTQLANLDRRFAKSNAKFIKDYLSGAPDQRANKRIKQSLARIEDWVGDLKPDQEASVAALLKAMPQMAEQSHAHRLVRQKALRGIFAANLDKDKLEVALNQWMIGWESGRTAEHERLWAQWLEQNRQLILKLTAMLTPQQRMHLTTKLRRFAEDFKRLHDQQG